MISLDTDTLAIQQLALEQISAQVQPDSVVRNVKSEKEAGSEKEKTTQATVADITKGALSEINSIITAEDSLVAKTRLAEQAYNYLADIRLQIGALREGLNDSELTNDITTLDLFDAKSNEIIDNVVNTMRKLDFSSCVDIDFTNIILDGLNSLKGLNIKDEDYLLNLDSLMANVARKENEYYNLENKLNSDTINNAKNYDKLVDTQNSPSTNSSSELRERIVKNASETLASVTYGITPEAVLRLLQG